jgi:hypothetical protein
MGRWVSHRPRWILATIVAWALALMVAQTVSYGLTRPFEQLYAQPSPDYEGALILNNQVLAVVGWVRALSGGAVTGALLGLLQCGLLRTSSRGRALWVAGSCVGLTVGIGVSKLVGSWEVQHSLWPFRELAVFLFDQGLSELGLILATPIHLIVLWLSFAGVTGWALVRLSRVPVDARPKGTG